MAKTEELVTLLQQISVSPDQVNGMLEAKGSAPIRQKVKANTLISRPHVGIQDLKELIPGLQEKLLQLEDEFIEQAEIHIKYEGYVVKEQEMVAKMQRLEDIILVDNLDYHQLHSLSSEAREKLSITRPKTLGQASRISGVSPADISVLMVYVGR
jgi:tRNA uridine 5-carboxymethylaminomethyl modification enzyme